MQRKLVPHAALAAETELQLRAVHAHLACAQRGEPVGFILARVLVVTHAHARGLQQAHHGGEYLVARQTGQRQVLAYATTDARQRLCKRKHAAVLRLVAHLAPAAVISILLAAARVAPVACRWPSARVNPDLLPSRRDSE